MMLCQPSYHSVNCMGAIGYHLNAKLKSPVTFVAAKVLPVTAGRFDRKSKALNWSPSTARVYSAARKDSNASLWGGMPLARKIITS